MSFKKFLWKPAAQPGQLSHTLSLYLDLDSFKFCSNSDISRSRVLMESWKAHLVRDDLSFSIAKSVTFHEWHWLSWSPGGTSLQKPLDIHLWLSMFSSNVSINKWILFFTCVFNLYHMRIELICLFFFFLTREIQFLWTSSWVYHLVFLKKQIGSYVFPSLAKMGTLSIHWLLFHTMSPSTEITKLLSVSLLALMQMKIPSHSCWMKLYLNRSWLTVWNEPKWRHG